MRGLLAAMLGAAVIVAAPAALGEPVGTWTGFYGGFDVGYDWVAKDTYVPGAPSAGIATSHPDSVALGGHFGYLHQFSNPLVLGVEADLSWLNGDAWGIYGGFPLVGTQAGTSWDGSLRAIAGLPLDGTLFYATGGWAWIAARGCNSYSTTKSECVTGTPFDRMFSGWTIGAGIARTMRDGLIGRLEYLHADYGTSVITGTGYRDELANVSIRSDTLRIGLSWKIGGP